MAASREDLVALADHMLNALRPHTSRRRAYVTPPGTPGPFGRAVDGFEGFARSFLIAGFRICGAAGDDPFGFLDRYATGLATGTDSSSDEPWPDLRTSAQARVEAASVALVLDLTRPWLWDQLSGKVQRRVINYLSPAVADADYWPNNWVWFRTVTQTFLRSVGGPFSQRQLNADLALHDSFERADGWYTDGAGRNFDHYGGWAMQLYPTLWARMMGAADLAFERRDRDRALLDRYLIDAIRLIGADGSPLIQGRSLIYRFAAAAPFWAGVLAEVPSIPASQLRHAATSIIEHFLHHDAPGTDGLLTTGWYQPWPALAQWYSGPSSPYWAAKGLLGITLPADHPVWAAPNQPPPAVETDAIFVCHAPGWLVSSTKADGVVRVFNHGTDHALPDSQLSESPLYARLSYSSTTFPLLDAEAWHNPSDNAVVLIDDSGRATHRCRLQTLILQANDDFGIAGSRHDACWMEVQIVENIGGGGIGEQTIAGQVSVVSITRGPWEVRAVHVTNPHPSVRAICVHGWVAPEGGYLISVAQPLTGGRRLTTHHNGASPVADQVTVPTVELDLSTGWQAVLVALARPETPMDATALLRTDGADTWINITWPDATQTTVPLPPA